MGVSGILERKALIDVDAHLPGRHHLEQLVSGSFKLLYLASHGIDLVIAHSASIKSPYHLHDELVAMRCIDIAITRVGDLSGTNGAHTVHY